MIMRRNNKEFPVRIAIEIAEGMAGEIEGERKLAPSEVPARNVVIRELLREALNLRANQRSQRRG